MSRLPWSRLLATIGAWCRLTQQTWRHGSIPRVGRSTNCMPCRTLACGRSSSIVRCVVIVRLKRECGTGLGGRLLLRSLHSGGGPGHGRVDEGALRFEFYRAPGMHSVDECSFRTGKTALCYLQGDIEGARTGAQVRRHAATSIGRFLLMRRAPVLQRACSNYTGRVNTDSAIQMRALPRFAVLFTKHPG